MIRNFIICSIFVSSLGCSTMADLAANALGGAIGNMIDRRVEDKLGNDAGLSDEKLDGKVEKKKKKKEFIVVDENNKEIK